MSVLTNTPVNVVFQPPKSKSIAALDMINNTIKHLNKSKAEMEASAASEIILAKKHYLAHRRKQALESMQRAHKNRVMKECIATALFQLIAMRIEMELTMNGFSEEASMTESILAKLLSTQISTPSDCVLMRKVARLTRN